MPAPLHLHAQAAVPVFDATNLHKATPLKGDWVIQAGDDLAYADPGYDDSHWTRVGAKSHVLRDLFPHAKPGVVWLRIHLKTAPDADDLAFSETNLADAFEIYANGVQILKSGSVEPYAAAHYQARLIARIPGDQIAKGSVVLAMRLRLTEITWNYPSSFGASDGLLVGDSSTLEDKRWLSLIGNRTVECLQCLLLLVLAIGAFLLYSAQRRREYLYLGLLNLCTALYLPLELYGDFHAYPWPWDLYPTLTSLLLYPILLTHTYMAFIGRRVRWQLNLLAVLAGLGVAISNTLWWMDSLSSTAVVLANAPFDLLISLVLPAILILEMRRGNRDARLLLLPLVLCALYNNLTLILFLMAYIPALSSVAMPLIRALNSLQVGPFWVDFNNGFPILSWLSLALIVLLRSNRQSRQQAALESEMANAREVQQVILPEASASVPGFQVESVYEPAKEVGGDFFQVLPDGEGGLLVVVGDVAGKGLPAAMMVSVLVGAIRSVAEFTSEPDEILEHLNRRLIGRTQGGFSTATAAHIAADGTARIANAGHLAPYLDGREIELPGALPLGIDARVRYEAQALTLPAGSRLVFYSDGVVEAQNASGELLGFESAAAMSRDTAVQIVNAAKQFGQSDDITVVAIAREGVAEAAAA